MRREEISFSKERFKAYFTFTRLIPVNCYGRSHCRAALFAAPVSHNVDGEKYAAVLTGSGSRHSNESSREIGKMLSFKLGGSVQLPAPLAKQIDREQKRSISIIAWAAIASWCFKGQGPNWPYLFRSSNILAGLAIVGMFGVRNNRTFSAGSSMHMRASGVDT